jgi:hypothetical protein
VVVEIDTWVWLDELGRALDRRVTLASVPEDAWDAALPPGTDAVWLMGVWQRSPYAAHRAHEVWADQARELLPDLTDADVPGSPYAVRAYVVDEHLGGDAGLAVARAELARRGQRLVLDLVPNHVAVEHPWLTTHPEVAVTGTAADLAAAPEAFLRVDGRVLACGRDPNLPAWSDVVQLDPFAASTRRLTAATLRSLGDRCDGVRVDMAMLFLDDVAERTWGERIGPPRPRPFWSEVIASVRTTHPALHLVAEAYWGREPELVAQGFDRCYDKSLTDELLAGDVAAVGRRLAAPLPEQQRTLRFLENHDERRSVVAFGPERVRAAAAVVALAPGGLLLFDGQLDGRRVHLPVGLGRRPEEPSDPELRTWYERLLALRRAVDRGRARWTPHRVLAGPAGTATDVLAWTWAGPGERTTVVAELGGTAAHVTVALDPPTGPCAPEPARTDRDAGRVDPSLRDALDGRPLHRAVLGARSLSLVLAPWEVVVVRR